MRRTFLGILLAIAAISSQSLFAQSNNDSILLVIENEKFSKDELVASFLKGNPNANGKIDKKEFQEYLELFINYKLKIRQAESLKMDTMPSYLSEYGRYRMQVISPHQIDYNMLLKLVNESYERMHTYKRASHILFKAKQGASPADTLAAFKKAMDAYKRLAKGELFDSVAAATSEDPSVRTGIDEKTGKTQLGNYGDLGYFTTLEMVYPIEQAAYSLEVGKYSKPLRSVHGYHIVKLTSSLKSEAKYKLQHIWTAGSQPSDSATGHARINLAYEELQKGRDFDGVVEEYSLERNVAATKGILPELLPTQVLPEYFEQAAHLSIGGYSKPFKTQYGWHIIKLISTVPVADFDEVKEMLKTKVFQSAERNQMIADSFDKQTKEKYQFKGNKNTQKELAAIQKMFTDSLFVGTWNYSENANLTQPLFSFKGENYTGKQFADYIKTNQKKGDDTVDFAYYLHKSYNAYIHELCMNLVDKYIEQDDIETRQVLQNYREGLLIFDINDQMVWTKAVVDTAGLKDFYEKNKQSHLWNPKDLDENYYMWKERADITTWYVDSNCIDYKKAAKIIEKGIEQKLTDAEIFENLKKKANKKCNADANIRFSWRVYEKNDPMVINDSIDWKQGMGKKMETEAGYRIDIVNKLIEPELKSLSEARGYYTNDYQNYLEKEWMQSLRRKYAVKTNTTLLNTIN